MPTKDASAPSLQDKIANLQAAVKKAQGLAQELEAVNATIREMRAELRPLFGDLQTAFAVKESTRGHGVTGEAIVEILREAGKPMSVREMSQALEARGLPYIMATVYNALTRLIHDGKVKKTSPGVYEAATPGE